jgi:hypothetical protein
MAKIAGRGNPPLIDFGPDSRHRAPSSLLQLDFAGYPSSCNRTGQMVLGIWSPCSSVRNLQVAGPPRADDNLQVPCQTPDSRPRTIDPRVFCRPTRAPEARVLQQPAGFR